VCLRSSSALEGVHLHYNLAIAPGATKAGHQMIEVASNDFDWQWSVKQMRKFKIVPAFVQHGNFMQRDQKSSNEEASPSLCVMRWVEAGTS
jgi:hypothetical protein